MEWLPIETAPKDGKMVLLAEDGYVDCGFWHDGSECHGHRGGPGWFSEDERANLLIARNIHPTHWMPLPPPPLPKEPGDWGASIVAHPVHIAEQRRQNQEARDTADGAMDPKEPA